MVAVKICGVNDAAALEAALGAGADMVGFVFFEGSPRHVSLAQGGELGRRVEGRATKVALTADADDATLAALIDAFAPDLLQLHGRESPERVRAVRTLFGVPVMRAIAVGSPDDLGVVSAFDAVCDQLLFDARAPVGGRPGGNGVAFRWDLLSGLSTRCRRLVAGGLHPGNVGAAVRSSGAHGVDVSSGVESSPGVKDAAAVAAFVAAARAASGSLPGR